MKQLFIIFISIILLRNNAECQQDTSHVRGNIEVLADIWGAELLGICIDYKILEKISLNAGVGINLSSHAGVNNYILSSKNSKHLIYAGVQAIFIRRLSTEILIGIGEPPGFKYEAGFYIPAGYEFHGRRRFVLQLEAGPAFIKENWGQTNTWPVIFAIRLGKILKSGKPDSLRKK